MTVFDVLPVVENCCLCINLKVGCILIAIYGILNTSADIYLFLIPELCKSDGIFAFIFQIVGYTTSVATILFLIANIIFLVGIYIDRRITAMLYLYCTALCILVFSAYFVCSILVAVFETECNVYFHIASIVVGILLWIYFMIVVRSYKDEMD